MMLVRVRLSPQVGPEFLQVVHASLWLPNVFSVAVRNPHEPIQSILRHKKLSRLSV